MTEIAFALVYIGLLATTAGHISLTQGASHHQSVRVAKIIFVTNCRYKYLSGTIFYQFRYFFHYQISLVPVQVPPKKRKSPRTGTPICFQCKVYSVN